MARREIVVGALSAEKDNKTWVRKLYDTSIISEAELMKMYDGVRYIGFDRQEMLLKMEEKLGDARLAIEAVLVCSLRGPRKAEEVKLSNGKTLKSMGILASDQKGTQNLSCQRISAATADLAAWYLKRLQIPKRQNSELPSWLQFPTAGSIKMPAKLRALHREFAVKFSKQIGGSFNEGIYIQMEHSAYLDPKLKLFDDLE